MADFNLSPNMSLPVPVVGVDPGPDYADNINSSLTILDSHNHAAGSGVQITPAGININTDLPLNNNNAITIKSSRYTVQLTPLSGGINIGCIYVSGVDLYYNDINGNQIQITSGGSVAGTPGSISGLISPASASYNSGPGTFIFQSAASTAGNIDGASITIREQVASANGVTLASPVSLAANYTLTFPGALPASTKFLTVNMSGNIGDVYDVDNTSIEISSNNIQIKNNGVTTAKILDHNVTQVKLQARTSPGATAAAGEIAVSTSSGSFTTTTGGAVDVTNLLVTITTTGRPVVIRMQDDGSVTQSSINSTATLATTNVSSKLYIDRGGVQISEIVVGTSGTSGNIGVFLPPSSFTYLDVVPAGTYTYKIQAGNLTVNTQAGVAFAILIAYEI